MNFSSQLVNRVVERYRFSFIEPRTIFDGLEHGSEMYEALFEHTNHNKRIDSTTLGLLLNSLKLEKSSFLVTPTRSHVYRGVKLTTEAADELLGKSRPTSGSLVKSFSFKLTPGSSWTTDYDQASYNSWGTFGKPVGIVVWASTSKNDFLDFRELYKLSTFRGVRLENEVMSFSSSVLCTRVDWETYGS